MLTVAVLDGISVESLSRKEKIVMRTVTRTELGLILVVSLALTLIGQVSGQDKDPRKAGEARPRKARQAAELKARKVREARRTRGDKRAAYYGKAYRGFATPGTMNVIDRARYTIASILIKQQRYGEAVEELQMIVEKSPDEETVAATHLNIGIIFHRHLNDSESAIQEFQKVTGRFADDALLAIIKTYEDMGNVQKAAETLEKAAAQAKDPGQKVKFLTEAANLYSRHNEDDKAIEVLRKITETISYEEAKKLEDASSRTGWGKDVGATEAALAAKLRALEAAGKHEEAAKLKAVYAEKTKRKKLEDDRTLLRRKRGKERK